MHLAAATPSIFQRPKPKASPHDFSYRKANPLVAGLDRSARPGRRIRPSSGTSCDASRQRSRARLQCFPPQRNPCAGRSACRVWIPDAGRHPLACVAASGHARGRDSPVLLRTCSPREHCAGRQAVEPPSRGDGDRTPCGNCSPPCGEEDGFCLSGHLIRSRGCFPKGEPHSWQEGGGVSPRHVSVGNWSWLEKWIDSYCPGG